MGASFFTSAQPGDVNPTAKNSRGTTKIPRSIIDWVWFCLPLTILPFGAVFVP